MLLDTTPRASGGKFWESKQWQGCMVQFFCLKHYHSAQQLRVPWQNPMLCKAFADWDTVCLLPHYSSCWFIACPPIPLSNLVLWVEGSATTDFLPLPSWLWVPSCRSIGHLHFPPFSPPHLFPVAQLQIFQWAGPSGTSLYCTGISLFNYSWLTCWHFRGIGQEFSPLSVISLAPATATPMHWWRWLHLHPLMAQSN